jgi:aspartate aminotransferase
MISINVKENLKSASLIRVMFEEGEKLRKIYGIENVYDFSLGNPDPEPPQKLKAVLKELVLEDKPGMHGYMSNAGFPEVRAKIAEAINRDTAKKLTGENIIMTCGAGGALNVVLKTLLNPGEEVIVFTPYFGEYRFYIDNYHGKIVELSTKPDTFEPDLDLLEKSITPLTKAVIINSPNNPTGVVYGEKLLKEMAALLEKKEKDFNTVIYVISDEPYSKLVYDSVIIPQILNIFKNSILVNSFSKSHSLAGERIGYIAVNDSIEGLKDLLKGLVFCNRILGYVNAPALFQKVVSMALYDTVDPSIYEERRDILYKSLTEMGYSCVKPQGAFYLFPKTLIPDDMEFKDRALKHHLVIIPGSGFKCPGHFRISYCVSLETIKNSLSVFEALARELLPGKMNLIKGEKS